MFDASEIASSTTTSAHNVPHSSSTSLRERPWTNCFQTKWVYVHIISSKVGTCSCGLYLSYAKHIIILLHPMLVYFLLPWVGKLLSRPLPWWISPSIIIEHQSKWRLYKETPTLWFWETDTKTWFFRSLKHFLLSNPIDAALEISWHYVTLCTLGQFYNKRVTSGNDKMDPDVQGTQPIAVIMGVLVLYKLDLECFLPYLYKSIHVVYCVSIELDTKATIQMIIIMQMMKNVLATTPKEWDWLMVV